MWICEHKLSGPLVDLFGFVSPSTSLRIYFLEMANHEEVVGESSSSRSTTSGNSTTGDSREYPFEGSPSRNTSGPQSPPSLTTIEMRNLDAFLEDPLDESEPILGPLEHSSGPVRQSPPPRDEDSRTISGRADSEVEIEGEDHPGGDRQVSSRGASSSGVPEKVPVPKGRKKATSEVREGHPDDAKFSTVSLVPPKESKIGEEGWLDTFYDELVLVKGNEGGVTQRKLNLVLPTRNDRAHDSEKGLCVYWRMPRCGFQLPLSAFARALLRALDVTPAQLTSTSWCTIASFELIFEEFKEQLRDARPTVPLFANFFTVAVSTDYLSVRRKLQGFELFDPRSNPRIQRIDAWNEAWVYISNPEAESSLKNIRCSWRVFGKGPGGKPKLNYELSTAEHRTIALLELLVKSQSSLSKTKFHSVVFLTLIIFDPFFRQKEKHEVRVR